MFGRGAYAREFCKRLRMLNPILVPRSVRLAAPDRDHEERVCSLGVGMATVISIDSRGCVSAIPPDTLPAARPTELCDQHRNYFERFRSL
jgi:hypothetical protein